MAVPSGHLEPATTAPAFLQCKANMFGGMAARVSAISRMAWGRSTRKRPAALRPRLVSEAGAGSTLRSRSVGSAARLRARGPFL
jgi:hypothetical protein